MDEVLGSLHWLLIIIFIGVMISFANKWLPQRHLAKLGALPCCSANWITTWSILIWYIGFGVYLSGNVFQGFVLLVIAGAFDKLDGHVARAQKECGFPRSLESAELGEWWDPLADKIRQLPVIAYMLCASIFTPYIAIPVIAVDVLGTFVRKPFTNDRVTKKYKIFAIVKDNLRQSKASRVGKAKSFFQVLALAAAMPYHQGWVDPGYVPDVILGIALPLGVLSVISRIKIHRDVDKAVDEVHAVFD